MKKTAGDQVCTQRDLYAYGQVKLDMATALNKVHNAERNVKEIRDPGLRQRAEKHLNDEIEAIRMYCTTSKAAK